MRAKPSAQEMGLTDPGLIDKKRKEMTQACKGVSKGRTSVLVWLVVYALLYSTCIEEEKHALLCAYYMYGKKTIDYAKIMKFAKPQSSMSSIKEKQGKGMPKKHTTNKVAIKWILSVSDMTITHTSTEWNQLFNVYKKSAVKVLKQKAIDAGCCIICLDLPATHAFIPCGHMCLCEGCAEKHAQEALKENAVQLCPCCRKEPLVVSHIYFAGFENDPPPVSDPEAGGI